MPRTTDELKAAAIHVSYEVRMLIFAGSHIRGWYSSPVSGPNEQETCMALESFLLHFRNLRAFLCPSLQRTTHDDVTAADFLDRGHLEDVTEPGPLERDKVRLDKMLAHLSYSRPDFIAEGVHAWNVPSMSIEILNALEAFLRELSPERGPWFLPVEEIEGQLQELTPWGSRDDVVAFVTSSYSE